MFGANDRAKFGNDRIGGFAALPPRHHPVTEVDDVVAHGGKDGAVADIAMAGYDRRRPPALELSQDARPVGPVEIGIVWREPRKDREDARLGEVAGEEN